LFLYIFQIYFLKIFAGGGLGPRPPVAPYAPDSSLFLNLYGIYRYRAYVKLEILIRYCDCSILLPVAVIILE